MTNTEYLYQAMKKYQDARSAARDEYMQTMKRLESSKGSAYYDEQREKAMKKRNDTVAAAQAECMKTVDNALSCMRTAISGRKMEAPTEEMLRILQMLSMRTSVTKAELDTAANAMNGNSTALAVLEDIARKHEVLGVNYASMCNNGLSPTKATETLREITKALGHRINDTVGASRAAQLAAAYHERRFGTGTPAQNWETANASVYSAASGKPGQRVELDDLPQEAAYEGERDFFSRMVSIPYEVLTKTLN